jgi:hypothetical protein
MSMVSGDVLYALPKNLSGIRKRRAMSEVYLYNCHVCHKDMEERNISPSMEWHICDKCMDIGESETFK